MRALILENSRLYRQLLDNILGQQGFKNDIAQEISIAKDYLQETQYDIICLNEHLQDGSGLELAKFCKADKALRDIPILFLTADDDFTQHNPADYLDTIIYKHNLQQISDQIVHFLEDHLDPVFSEGKILFIEDSKSVAHLIITALEQHNYQVDFHMSADNAWNEFIEEVSYGSDFAAYDLIITDVNVEGEMNGLDLTRKVRQLDDARGFIPIMAITAQADADLRLSLFQASVSDFIQKPILVDELLVRVKNLITNKRLLDKVHDQRRELFTLATTDKLTGCQNRHSLMEYAAKFISQAIRHQFAVSLMVIDLDHFKQINDTHGHAVGDIVLQEIGRLLNDSFREGDMVARFGGEEFVVLLDHTSLQQGLRVAEKLRQKIEDLQPHQLPVSASIGIASLEPGMDLNFETLFHNADLGVYQAKENGRNQVQHVTD
ncbi:MAG: diguanylate cyclase [Gammaproteobacteria bacterium]|nr:diguanylate cyclase [Gammaproteobacteria bacterium]